MKSKLYCKILAVGIIVLFVGVSYTSSVRVENKTPIFNSQVEAECGCFENYDSLIFDILETLYLTFDIRANILNKIYGAFEDISSIAYIIHLIGLSLFLRANIILDLAFELNCDWIVE